MNEEIGERRLNWRLPSAGANMTRFLDQSTAGYSGQHFADTEGPVRSKTVIKYWTER